MTIGIGAAGRNAGLAVFRALQAAERVGAGSIGGFATFAAITSAGEVLRTATNRGGSRTLFTEGETTGVEPPPAVAGAVVAGVISSGPDRPHPLDQFVAADGRVGLVTGHRLPNRVSIAGKPYNEDALHRMASGAAPREAVEAIMEENPEGDVGLVAVTFGGAWAANSARVLRRPDLGHARREGPECVVEVLLNSIRPVESLASVVADVTLDVMAGEPVPAGWLTVTKDTPLVLGDADAVILDTDDMAREIVTTEEHIVSGRHNCAAIYFGAQVIRNGRPLGRTLFEPNVVVEDGRIVSLNGQDSVRVSYG